MSREHQLVSIEDDLDASFEAYVRAGQAPGLAYGIVGPDGLSHSRGFGVANDDGAAPDLDTVFPIASMTKSFVACAALIARDRGLLSLEDPVTAYLPEFTGTGTDEHPCDPPTLRMLLSMSGGLTEDNSWVDPFIDQPVARLLERVAAGVRYSHLPGTTFEYSNLGFTLAGLAVGKAAGRPIEDVIRDEILVPLGLTSTWFDNAIPDAAEQVRAQGYSLDLGGEWTPFPPVASAAFAAAGGIQSSVRDLARWIGWLGSAFRPPAPSDTRLSDAAQPGPEAVLSRASRREMQRLHSLDLPAVSIQPEGALRVSVTGYGLGLLVSQELHRGTVVSHSGGLPGFKLFMVWHPDSGHGLVSLTNSHRGDPIELTRRCLMRLLEKHESAAHTVRLWPDTVRLRRDTERLIRNWDDDLAGRLFAENIEFDRPLALRRRDIEALTDQVGPLLPQRPVGEVTSSATAADVTWTIPGERGDLVVMLHLTPVNPAQIQELEVRAMTRERPIGARPHDISAHRGHLGDASITPLTNVRVIVPGT